MRRPRLTGDPDQLTQVFPQPCLDGDQNTADRGDRFGRGRCVARNHARALRPPFVGLAVTDHGIGDRPNPSAAYRAVSTASIPTLRREQMRGHGLGLATSSISSTGTRTSGHPRTLGEGSVFHVVFAGLSSRSSRGCGANGDPGRIRAHRARYCRYFRSVRKSCAKACKEWAVKMRIYGDARRRIHDGGHTGAPVGCDC